MARAFGLVSTAVGAFTPDQEVWTGVDVNSIFRNTLFTVSYFRRRGGIDLVDAGEWDVLLSTSDVGNVIERPLWLEGPVH